MVRVNDADFSNSGGSEVEQRGGAEASRSDAEDGGVLEPFLTGFAEFCEHGLAQVAVGFIRGERHGETMSL